MKLVNPMEKRTAFITARASSRERMRAEEIMAKMNLSSHAALVRQLIEEKACELGVN